MNATQLVLLLLASLAVGVSVYCLLRAFTC